MPITPLPHVRAFQITDEPGVGPVRVYLEDLAPGHGRVTIESFGSAWTCQVHMSDSTAPLPHLICEVDPDYLVSLFMAARSAREAGGGGVYLGKMVAALQNALKAQVTEQEGA